MLLPPRIRAGWQCRHHSCAVQQEKSTGHPENEANTSKAGMSTISSTDTPIRSSSRPTIFRLSTITTLVAAFINKISEELGVRRKGFAISKETLTILPLESVFPNSSPLLRLPVDYKYIFKTTGYKNISIPDCQLYICVYTVYIRYIQYRH